MYGIFVNFQLEDKRVEMEKKLLSMQVKHVSIQKAYSFVKSQLHNMKVGRHYSSSKLAIHLFENIFFVHGNFDVL